MRNIVRIAFGRFTISKCIPAVCDVTLHIQIEWRPNGVAYHHNRRNMTIPQRFEWLVSPRFINRWGSSKFVTKKFCQYHYFHLTRTSLISVLYDTCLFKDNVGLLFYNQKPWCRRLDTTVIMSYRWVSNLLRHPYDLVTVYINIFAISCGPYINLSVADKYTVVIACGWIAICSIWKYTWAYLFPPMDDLLTPP